LPPNQPNRGGKKKTPNPGKKAPVWWNPKKNTPPKKKTHNPPFSKKETGKKTPWGERGKGAGFTLAPKFSGANPPPPPNFPV